MADVILSCLEQIKEWQNKVLGTVYPFAVSGSNITTMFSLMDRNRTSEARAQIELDLIEKEKEYYQRESLRYEQLLQEDGVSLDSLNYSTQTKLQELAEIAVKLNIKDPDLTSFLLAIGDLRSDCRESSQDLAQSQGMRDKSVALRKMLQLDLENLQGVCDSVSANMKKKEKDSSHKSDKMDFYVKKQAEYSKNAKKMKEMLMNNGYDKNLHHESLLKMREELQTYQNKLKPLAAKLAVYQDLPPDYFMATEKLQKTLTELKKAEEEFEKQVGGSETF